MPAKERVMVDFGRGVVVLDAVMDGMGAYATLTTGGNGAPPWPDSQAVAMLKVQEEDPEQFWFVGYHEGEWTALVRLPEPHSKGISHGVGKYHRVRRTLKVMGGAMVEVAREMTPDEAAAELIESGWGVDSAVRTLAGLDEGKYVGAGTYHVITKIDDGMFAYGYLKRRREV